MISLHSDLVYTYEQQIFIDEIQVYSRRHIQLASTRDDSGGQLSQGFHLKPVAAEIRRLLFTLPPTTFYV